MKADKPLIWGVMRAERNKVSAVIKDEFTTPLLRAIEQTTARG